MTFAVDEAAPPANLAPAGIYRRVVRASIARVWENVFDWEHLPVLHESTFNRVELLQRDCSGWRVRLSRQPGDAERLQVVELVADRAAGKYCVTTLAGVGTGTQIRTELQAIAAHGTAVAVHYFVPERSPEKLASLAAKYLQMYERLWDEDEAMMMHRERMLHRPRAAVAAEPLPFGHIDDVRAQLPKLVEFGGKTFRLVEIDNQLVAHAAWCPHWLGPLDQAPVADGCVRCPWHGYLFDVRTGASADGRGLRLAAAPQVHVDSATGQVTLLPKQNA
jgi:nitrite reductase/ring-hydroxylating ferredoxin subunit